MAATASEGTCTNYVWGLSFRFVAKLAIKSLGTPMQGTTVWACFPISFSVFLARLGALSLSSGV